MAVKVGNSWVSEAALSYAKVKADSGESATLNGLLDRYPGVNFSTNTQAFSQKGTNNIQIAPIILAQMQNNPDKRIEYEALIYDCAKLISSGAMDWAPAGSHVKAAGTIINADGSVSGWAITEDDNGDESREKTKLLEMHKQKRIKEKKEAQKRLEKKSIDLDPTLSCNINVTA